ncbi:MAG: ABC transporter transmembrane domain-containing protein, partial [Candidatus Limnocylindrales bacterium]
MSGPMGNQSGRRAAGGMGAGTRAGGTGGFGGPGGRRRGPMGGGFGPPGHGMLVPAEKANHFRATFRRLLRELRPERQRIGLVAVVALLSTAGQVFGPKILGNGINKLMDGLVGKMLGQYLPPGTTHEQAVAAVRQTQPKIADLVAGTNAVPGVGVDFAALGMILLALAALYLMATFFTWVAWYTMAGVSQRTVYRLRREVDQKLGRLPLKYFDTHPRGDTLSRVTNDIDNIANTLQ